MGCSMNIFRVLTVCVFKEDYPVTLSDAYRGMSSKISFMHLHGPSASFTYPYELDVLMVKRADITEVDSQTLTGWTCMLPPQDMQTVTVNVNSSFHTWWVILAKCILPLCLLSCYHGSLCLDKYS